MAEVDINWVAVLAAALVGLIVGGLWYGPLFGDAWMRSLGLDPVVVKSQPSTGLRRRFSIVFMLQWVMALCLAMFIGNAPDLLMGALYGFLAGLPWVAFALAVNALFEQKPASYIFINGAYWTITFTLMGLIIGWWM